MGVKMRNTIANGGMTGKDSGIQRIFAYREGKSYSQVKKASKPSNPNTEAQQLTRNAFSAASIGWSGLTADERTQWNLEAKNVHNVDQFGSKEISGKNFHAGANIALVNANLDTISSPKNMSLDAEIGYADFSKVGAVLNLDVQLDVTSIKNAVVLSVSEQKSAGTSAFPKVVSLTTAKLGADVNDDVTAIYVAKYGALTNGKKIFWTIDTVTEGGNRVTLKKGAIVI